MANGLIPARPEYLKAELVWANASPASYFAAQTVPLDLPENAVLVIEHTVHIVKADPSASCVGYTVIKVGTDGVIDSAYLGAAFRRMGARTSGVIFSDGYYVNVAGETIAHNGLNVPLRIYALKGVYPPVQIDGPTYSTDETWTGERWIDGKKIYQKVVTGNLTQNPADTILGVTSGMAQSISVEVVIAKGQRRVPYIECSAANTPNWAYSYTAATHFADNLVIQHGTSIPLHDFVAILRYTKTEV